MPLSAGEKLGPYEIIAIIGAGGMGEVYRARDPRLDRDVAIKISAERFGERFEREARVIASLNHSNVCTLHDVGPNYLVMELIEGPTLADRINQGAIPFDEALSIAKQIADALEAAHEKGIVHRDLKPGNVKITPVGIVKVLDFGLATGANRTISFDNSPTLTGGTEAGMILGTAAYMAPEQAKGKPVDRRADIWAFGVVLYEMFTGQRLFQGETTTEILASVIKEEPKWDNVPQQVQRLLRRCLEKDPQKRLRHIGDVMALVDEELAGRFETARRLKPAPQLWLWQAVAALLVIAFSALALVHFREQLPPAQQIRFQLLPPDKTVISLGSAFVVSPDGRHLAFAAAGEDKVTRLWIRSLDSLEARPLPGGEMSATPPPMFWSPDSRYVVFQDEGKLKKVDIAGGPVQTLCDVTGFVVSGSWNRDGQIILGNNVAGKNGGALMRVPSAGGACSPLTQLDSSRGERYHSFPTFLPDGRHFVYHRFSGPTNSGIYVGSLDAKPEEQSTHQLVATPNGGAYVPPSAATPGQLLFMRDGTLMVQRFDERRLELAGEAVPLAEAVGTFLNFAFFSVSANGVLVYRAGSSQSVNQLTWLDRQGKRLGTVGEPGVYVSVVLSPDGTRAAIARADSDIWLMDLARGVSTRFTFGRARSQNPVWSPDGTRIIFASDREGGVFNLYQKLASGAKEEELLLKSPESKLPTSWSRDGRFLLYTAVDSKNGNDVWVMPFEAGGTKAGEPKPFLRTEFQERFAHFSLDSRWIAYSSNESGRDEIYIRSFSPSSPAGDSDGGKWMISRGAGSGPAWTSSGKELVYLASDFKVTAVEVAASAALQFGLPRTLFQWPGGIITAGAFADDGRILAPLAVGPGTPAPFTVVLNWQAALKK